MKLKALIGSGDRIVLFSLPFVMVGLILNFLFPAFFSIGGLSLVLKVISFCMLIPGVTIWVWSIALILTKIPRQELITTGPYAWVKHPLYTNLAFLVLPWFGFLLNTWILLVMGIILYIGVRIFAREEEELLSKTFGPAWDEYRKQVKLPWL